MQAEEIKSDGQQELKEAQRLAHNANLRASGSLYNIFVANRLAKFDPASATKYKPNDQFIEDWKVPEPGDDPSGLIRPGSITEEIDERPTPDGPIASSLGLSSTASEHARRIETNQQSKSRFHQAEEELLARHNELLQIRAKFDRRREQVLLPENRDDSSEAGLRHLQEDIDLTRQLVEAEDKFREARRKA